jgi:hypothetical protein
MNEIGILRRLLQNDLVIMQALQLLRLDCGNYPLHGDPQIIHELGRAIEATELRLRRTWAPIPAESE